MRTRLTVLLLSIMISRAWAQNPEPAEPGAEAPKAASEDSVAARTAADEGTSAESAAVAATPSGSLAEPPTPTPAPVEPPAEASEKAVAKESAAEASKEGRVAEWTFDHFFDHIKVRGYTQFRFNAPTTNSDFVNVQGDRSMGGDGGFFIRRARVILYGDVHPLVSVYLQPDFASTTESGLHYVQLRDWYVDISEPSKQLRLRVGQSKVPFGFENMQSSQNRLPLDRSDALNSALANERDLGAFLYWAPTEIRKRFKHLVDSGLKGSGDYGVAALGVYNGQTANRADENQNKHVVARLTYPFQFGQQFVEFGGGGYAGRYVVKKDPGIVGDEEFWDARGHLAFVLYPQPFGLQVEYNVGVGPELRNVQSQTTGGVTAFSGTVEEGFLHGGYALASLKLDDTGIGTIIPYVRGVLYEGGKKHETNAPNYTVREVEVGVEWQPFKAFEFVGSFLHGNRTFAKLPYQPEEGQTGRFQIQINY